MAVKTMLTDEGMPWDNVGWVFSGDRLSTAAGRAAAYEVLRFLSPSLFSRAGDRWISMSCVACCPGIAAGWTCASASATMLPLAWPGRRSSTPIPR